MSFSIKEVDLNNDAKFDAIAFSFGYLISASGCADDQTVDLHNKGVLTVVTSAFVERTVHSQIEIGETSRYVNTAHNHVVTAASAPPQTTSLHSLLVLLAQ